MIEKLKRSVSPTTCSDKIIYCVSKCAEKYPTAESLHSAQFDPDGKFYEDLLVLWEAIETSPIKPTVAFVDESDKKEEDSLELNLKKEISTVFKICPNLVIIMDEAVGLINNIDDISFSTSPIRTIYRQFNEGPDGLVGLFLSTSSNMKGLIPNHKGSGGPNIKRDLTPITDIRFFDLFAKDDKIEEDLKLYFYFYYY